MSRIPQRLLNKVKAQNEDQRAHHHDCYAWVNTTISFSFDHEQNSKKCERTDVSDRARPDEQKYSGSARQHKARKACRSSNAIESISEDRLVSYATEHRTMHRIGNELTVMCSHRQDSLV